MNMLVRFWCHSAVAERILLLFKLCFGRARYGLAMQMLHCTCRLPVLAASTAVWLSVYRCMLIAMTALDEFLFDNI